MKWGTLKNAVRDLGFEEDSIFDEYRDIFINSTNRAMKFINMHVRPVQSCLEIEQEGDESGLERYDLADENDFMELYGTPSIEKDGDIEDFSRYRVEQDTVIVLDKSIKGTIRFFYRKLPTPVTENTSDETELDVLKGVDVLLPLLTAHYVWLDDDKEKAQTYWEEFSLMKNEILSDMEKNDNGIRATVYGGFSW